MSNPQDVAVAFMLEQNRIETEKSEQELRAMFEKGYKAPKARAAKAPKAKKDKAEKAKPIVPIAPQMIFSVTPGTVGPQGFLKLLRNAKDRQQSMEAIHAYCGYDMAGDFGTQEYRAKAKAQNEIKPVVVKDSVKATLSGYVAGMPNNQDKFKQNLFARERLAVDSHIENVKKAETATEERDRKLYEGLAQVEMDRVRVIRQDIRATVGQRNTMIGLG